MMSLEYSTPVDRLADDQIEMVDCICDQTPRTATGNDDKHMQ